MEFLSKGSLNDFLGRPEVQKSLNVSDLINMAINVCSGMIYLGKNNIVHRDLSARNLLVSETDGRFVVKVADLGLSRETADDYYVATDSAFPVKWSPPEVIEHRTFTTKSDVWSFGVVMWEIFEFGKVPYSSMSNSETIASVMKGYRLPQPSNCPNEVYQLMLKCWNINSDERPSFKDLFDQLTAILPSTELNNLNNKTNQNIVPTTVDSNLIYN